MLKLLAYLLGKGVVTSKNLFPPLEEGVRGLPAFSAAACAGAECNNCVDECPTEAIRLKKEGSNWDVFLDIGACIACGACVSQCPTGTLINDRSTKTARQSREQLIISSADNARAENARADNARAENARAENARAENARAENARAEQQALVDNKSIFAKSIAIRVVSTGCSACDLEIGAAGNPIFDMERFGVHVVASPRFADVLLVTGPVPKAMHDPLLRCYEAMAEPRLVVAAGTCAISGGVHKDGYTEANGADSIVPVDVYIPGCPPHPWSIIYGVHLAMTARHEKKKAVKEVANPEAVRSAS